MRWTPPSVPVPTKPGALLMIRRIALSALTVAFLIPGQAASQGIGNGASSPPLSPEAEVFIGTLEAIRDYALDAQADSVLWERAIEGLMRELGDPYAAVLSPDEVRAFEEQSTGNYAGIGVGISPMNGTVTITHVYANTPADNAGLHVGDRIVGVNEDRAEAWTVEDTSNRIRGLPGTIVRVLIDRDGADAPISFEIRREQVHIPAVTSHRIFGDLGYIGLDRVTRNSAAEVDSVLTELAGVRGIILDLRRNPGGYLDESLNLADLFLDRGSVLVRTRSRTRGSDGEIREEAARARLTPRVQDVPVVVLVDQFSASAAEIIAGALQDHDRALVIGERTFGKGTVQSVIPLPEGRLIRLTSGEWYTPQGRSINRLRSQDGQLIDSDLVEEFTSRGGRTILGGGGVFPDLEIEEDTLSSAELNFFTRGAEAEVPVQQRIREAAFAVAQSARVAGTVPESFPAGAFEEFRSGLIASGMDAELFTTDVDRYLLQRAGEELFQRMDRLDLYLQLRSDRDRALATAVGFLLEADSQDALFALAASAVRTAAVEPVDGTDPAIR